MKVFFSISDDKHGVSNSRQDSVCSVGLVFKYIYKEWHMRYITQVLSLAFLFSVSSCNSDRISSDSQLDGIDHSGDRSISVMTYNVENLFDTEHDEGKGDYEFLPRSNNLKEEGCRKFNSGKSPRRLQSCLKFNWTAKALKEKMLKLKKVIQSVNNGKGPDVLVMPEIENRAVLVAFNKVLDLGYSIAFVDGDERFDRRGIDSAVFSRLDVVETPKLHYLADVIKEGRKDSGQREIPINTRGLLEVTLELPNGEMLSVFAVHLPSPGHPFIEREAAFGELTRLAKLRSAEGNIVLAAGDFNHTSAEEAGVSKKGRQNKNLPGKHFFKKDASNNWFVSNIIKTEMNKRGSAYYKRGVGPYKWSFLDAIMLFKSKAAKAKINMESLRVVVLDGVNADQKGRPWRLSYGGVSDHFPLFMKLKLQE